MRRYGRIEEEEDREKIPKAAPNNTGGGSRVKNGHRKSKKRGRVKNGHRKSPKSAKYIRYH